jgi:hypothetical protein
MVDLESRLGSQGKGRRTHVSVVYLVMETKAAPSREVVRVVCANKERADRYLATEGRDTQLRIVEEPVLR